MENCHFFPEQMMSMASIALVEAGVHHQDIMKGHMMIELEITHLCDHMTTVDDQTLCHQVYGISVLYIHFHPNKSFREKN